MQFNSLSTPPPQDHGGTVLIPAGTFITGTIHGGDISKAAKPLAFAAGAVKKSVKLRA